MASFPAPNRLDVIGDSRSKLSASAALLNLADALHIAVRLPQRDFGWGVDPFQAFIGAQPAPVSLLENDESRVEDGRGRVKKWEEGKPSLLRFLAAGFPLTHRAPLSRLELQR